MIVVCPNCKIPIVVQKLNCGIFRHGIYIKTGKQRNPHLDQKSCERLLKKNIIYGCGKPFRIVDKNTWKAIECEYI